MPNGSLDFRVAYQVLMMIRCSRSHREADNQTVECAQRKGYSFIMVGEKRGRLIETICDGLN